jgi:LL-diaminopimelate aminotransferase
VIHEKKIYRDYLGTDASMADLMRPGLYGAYHHISVVGKETAPADHVYDVTGSLCENNDKFAVQRKLPETKPGDLLVIHDTGAHGRAMCFNYNGKLRSGEVLRRTDGSFVQIRRRETMDDYFATLDFAALDAFGAQTPRRRGNDQTQPEHDESFGRLPLPRDRTAQEEFLAGRPDAKLISLGIGNTTEPLGPVISAGLEAEARALSTASGYNGYGDEQGQTPLRAAIARVLYRGSSRRMKSTFQTEPSATSAGSRSSSAPACRWPYRTPPIRSTWTARCWRGPRAEGGGLLLRHHLLALHGGERLLPGPVGHSQGGGGLLLLAEQPHRRRGDQAQLAALVDECRRKGSLIVFDSAYAEYISDPALPKSIFEIEGARECAIEVSSFSKPIGFCGVRLGWSVVPAELKYEDGTPVSPDWNRIMTTIFNGASNIAQKGGLAALTSEGQKEMRSLIAHYMGNARIIKKALDALKPSLGVEAHGGDNAPYIWARFPGRTSWDVFAEIMDRCEVVTTPGAGFGPAGEGYIRFSAFGHRADVEEAAARLARLA